MATPTSIRIDEDVTARLASFVARHPGATRSAVAARFVDEGLRMDEHPGIVFREGATGRRATIVGGPDVWEVVRAVKAARTAEPDLDELPLLAMLEDNTGVPEWMIRTALGYWSAYPDEVDAFVEHAQQTEAAKAAAVARERGLVGR